MKAILAALATLSASAALAKPPRPPAPAPTAKPVAKPVAIKNIADMPLEALDGAVLEGKPVASAVVKSSLVDEVTKLDLGADYRIKAKRDSATPRPEIDIEQFEVQRLKENQVSAIVKERADDLEYCWLRLPPAKRVVSAAILHMNIAATGKVASVEVNGDLPAGVGKCITQMASRWVFPAADAATEIDHGIMLTTTSQK